MITYQRDVKKSSAVECGRGDFLKEVSSQKNNWNIDARRAVKAAVKADLEGEGVAAIHTWLENTDYQKFLLNHQQHLKSKLAKEAFAKKSDEDKLLLWAESLKQSLTAFIFSSYLFDEVKCKKKHIVFGMVEDKDMEGVMALLPKDATYYFAKADNKRAVSETVLKFIGEQQGLTGEGYPTVAEAYHAAKKAAETDDFVFIGGSTYVVADLLKNAF